MNTSIEHITARYLATEIGRRFLDSGKRLRDLAQRRLGPLDHEPELMPGPDGLACIEVDRLILRERNGQLQALRAGGTSDMEEDWEVLP